MWNSPFLPSSKERTQLAAEGFLQLAMQELWETMKCYQPHQKQWLQLWSSVLGNTLWSALVRNGWGICRFKFGEKFHGPELKKESQYSEFLAGISATVSLWNNSLGFPTSMCFTGTAQVIKIRLHYDIGVNLQTSTCGAHRSWREKCSVIIMQCLEVV